jgi:hypothetical protein
MKSLYAPMNANNAVTAIAGRAAANTTRKNAENRVAPSTIAASSKSTGMVSQQPEASGIRRAAR